VLRFIDAAVDGRRRGGSNHGSETREIVIYWKRATEMITCSAVQLTWRSAAAATAKQELTATATEYMNVGIGIAVMVTVALSTVLSRKSNHQTVRRRSQKSAVAAAYAVRCLAYTEVNEHSVVGYTHTRARVLNGLLSGTTRVSRYQKGKTNLDFTEARDSEWQSHQLGYMQVCISLQTDNDASTPPLSFYTVRMPFLPPNQQRQSTEGYTVVHTYTYILIYIAPKIVRTNLRCWHRITRR